MNKLTGFVGGQSGVYLSKHPGRGLGPGQVAHTAHLLKEGAVFWLLV